MDQLGLHPEDDKELNGSAGPSSRGNRELNGSAGHHPDEDKELNGSAGPSSRGRQGTEWISWAFIQRKTRN